jgi:hypothetical protein
MFQKNLLPTLSYPEDGGSKFIRMLVLKNQSTKSHNPDYHKTNIYLKSEQEQHITQSAKVHAHSTIQFLYTSW